MQRPRTSLPQVYPGYARFQVLPRSWVHRVRAPALTHSAGRSDPRTTLCYPPSALTRRAWPRAGPGPAHGGVVIKEFECALFPPRAAFMRGELTLARCLLPPISPIKNILPSRSARSSPGPQLYSINTFRQVQKGMIHAGPERSKREAAERFHRASVLSWTRPGPRGVSSLLHQGPGLPGRSWKDLPAQPPFGTP